MPKVTRRPKVPRRRGTRRTYRSRLLKKYRNSENRYVYAALAIIIGSFCLAWLANVIYTNYRNYQLASQKDSIVGQPSVDAQFINQVLAHYHSPASGKGQALYDDGVRYGIDPAYALAFFMEESSFGTQGVAAVTHSLGNIRATPGYPAYHGYRFYNTWEDGFEDWYRLMADQYVGKWGLYTVEQIIPTYAPGADNNDEMAYIRTVKTAVRVWRSGVVEV